MNKGEKPGRRAVVPYVLAALVVSSVVLLGTSEQGILEPQSGSEGSAVYAAVRCELVEANTRFALDLYHALSKADGNLFLSPYSVSAALAMTYAGARGETEHQMRDTLRFTLPQRVLHPAFHALDGDFTEKVHDVEGVRLSIANALWGQDGHPFLPSFLGLLEASYDAPMALTDFVAAAEQARTDINDWVRDETQGKIKDLMKPGSVTPDTRLVLANAIYFYGTWKLQFDEAQTTNEPFYRLDGSDVSVPTMKMQDLFAYAEEADYQAIELAYTGDALSMLILLPEEGAFREFEASLGVERLDEILAQMDSREVRLAMPRFELTSEFSLAGTLAGLGMPDAFSGAADFSGMDGLRDLLIGHVAHKAFVSVNEEGTEAAAATGVSMVLSLPRYARMTINRPFVFLIRDVETGTILFIGRVMDPSEG
jgi:serpin B